MPLAITDYILGFDIRETPEAAKLRWSDERRQNWLINPVVEVPLSTDGMIWYSLIDSKKFFVDGWLQFVWSDLDVLQEFWGKQPQDQDYCIYCASIVEGPEELAQTPPWMEYCKSVAKYKIDQTWALLGHDVSDEWLLSGVTNCTHVRNKEYPVLQNRFAHRLNRYHLFDAIEDAVEFRSVANQVFPDHAPFWVYRVWMVEMHGLEKNQAVRD